MAQLKVVTTGINNGISELTRLNTEFRSKVSSLVTTEARLNNMWEGEARTAFHNAFTSDEGQMESFAECIDNYVSVLEEILTLYKQMESLNVETATVRTYK